MPVLGETKNIGVEAMTAVCTWLGLYTAATATTGWKSINSEELEKTAHGYVTGDLIWVKECSEGGTGSLIKKGEPLYVEKVSANVIKLSQTVSIKAEKWTVEIKGTVELEKLTEVSGAPYKRIKAKWNAIAANGVQEDTEKHEVPCANPTTVDAVSMHTAESGGSLRKIEKVTKETVLEAKAFGVSNSLLDLVTANVTAP